jgi:hypothetical protein
MTLRSRSRILGCRGRGLPAREVGGRVFGDTVAVNGQVICGPSHCAHGYPHDSIQQPLLGRVLPDA